MFQRIFNFLAGRPGNDRNCSNERDSYYEELDNMTEEELDEYLDAEIAAIDEELLRDRRKPRRRKNI